MYSINIASSTLHRIDSDADTPTDLGRVVVFRLSDDGSASTSFVIKAKVAGDSAATAQAIPYTFKAGTAAGATIAAGTALTHSDAGKIYEVDAAGLNIYVDVTHTSGAYSLKCATVTA